MLRDADDFMPKVQRCAPDIVLLDLKIAGFGGKIISEYIKPHGTQKHIPVILMPANQNIHEVKEQCGANDIVQKPFDFHRLLKTAKVTTKAGKLSYIYYFLK